MHHRAVGEYGDRRTATPYGRLPQSDRFEVLRHLAEAVRLPRHDRAIVVSVERPVVEPLWLKKNDGIRIQDGCKEQALGVGRNRRNDRLEAGYMGEERFGALTMGLRTIDSAPGRHPDHEGAGEFASGTVP